MSKYAAGKYAYGISDRSGFRYRIKDMRKEWNGLLVGYDEWEAKHPQIEPIRAVPDAVAIKNARPEQDLPEQRTIQYGWGPVGFKEVSGVTPPNDLVANGQVGVVNIFFPPVPLGIAVTGSVGTVTVVV